MLFALFLVTTLLITKIQESSIQAWVKKENGSENDAMNQLIIQLDQTFSFARIVDSKFIGLFNFFFSNIFTGCVNLLINTLNVTSLYAFIIICTYTLLSFMIPLIFYRILN